MARKTTDTVLIEHDSPIPDNASEIMDASILGNIALTESAEALALELKYDGPLHPDALEASIGESRSRVNMELFSMGAKLLLLKEQCEHGDFLGRCERLGMEPRLVQRTMQAALKFSDASTSTHLAKLSKSKIFELLVLDDEEVAALAENGSARGITFDDIDGWSVAELRKQLRDARADIESKNKLIADKNTKLDDLQTKAGKKKTKLATPEAELTFMHAQASALSRSVGITLMAEMRALFTEIGQHHETHGGTGNDVMLAYLETINRELVSLRDDFGLDDNHIPEWMTWNEEIDAKAPPLLGDDEETGLGVACPSVLANEPEEG